MASDCENQFEEKREVRSFLMSRDPSVDRCNRPRPNLKTRLFENINETEESNGSESEDTESYEESSRCATAESVETSEVQTGTLVYLRLRPTNYPSSIYNVLSCGTVLEVGPSADAISSSSTNKGNFVKHHNFSAIFESSVGQRDVYDMCVGPKIQDEESFSLMMYGTSGSGKTYTLLGDDTRPGVVPRALENVFTVHHNNIHPQPAIKLVNSRVVILEDSASKKESQMSRALLAACPNIDMQYKRMQQVLSDEHNFEMRKVDDVSVFIWVSFVEIYNENVYDLLELQRSNSQPVMMEPPRKSLKIVANNGEVFIKGLTSIHVRSALEALRILRYGLQRVTYASTSVNTNSSRSHCVFFVDMLKFYRSGETIHTCYKFCDLAGSERLNKTCNVGSRLKEAQRINTSLMVLGRCLYAASTAHKKITSDIIPFRESKLTMLLQSALLGKEKLAMIVTLTPLDKYYEENQNVLNFASIARDIVYVQAPVKQTRQRYSAFLGFGTEPGRVTEDVHELEEEIIALRQELDDFRAQHIEELNNVHVQHIEELQKQEEVLRKTLFQTSEERIRSIETQWDAKLQTELYNQKRFYEAMLESQKRKFEEKLEDLQDEIDELRNGDSNDVIEIV